MRDAPALVGDAKRASQSSVTTLGDDQVKYYGNYCPTSPEIESMILQ